MASNKTATIIFKGDDQISPAIKGATASVAGLSKSLDAVDTEAKQAADSIRDNLVKQIEAAQQKLKSFASQGLKVEQGRALAELNKLNRELKRLDAPIVIKPKIEFDSLQLNAISQSFGAIAGKLTELRSAAVGAFGEIAAAERKLSTVSNQSKELIKNFGDLAAANKFQTTTAELATASYEVLSAGFTDAADVTKILEASTKGAVGGFSDVTTVSKATISALNAYGAGADQAAAFVDKFVSVQQSGLITVDQYASQIARIAPTAAAAGLSLDELNGAIATATASGVPVESTFAGLRTALAAILKPSSEASELAKELGLNFNAAGLKTLGLSGILEQLKTTGNDSADTLLKLFGSTEALAAIAPSINAIDKLKANIQASADSAGLAATNAEKAVDPIKALANETTEALAILGRDIVKVFNPVLQGTKAVIAAFRELPEPLQQVIAFVVGGGAAIATTGAAISGFLAVLSPTLAGLSALGGSVATAFALLNVQVTALGAKTLITNAIQKAQIALMANVGASSGVAASGVAGLSVSLKGLAVATAAVLLPTIALSGAIATIAWSKAAADLSDYNKELDATIGNSTQAGNNATRLADRLKSLANERKKGGAVTDEQIRKEKEYLKLADQEIATQKRLLDEAKKLKPANDEQRNSQAALISGYEISIKQLESQKKALSAAAVATKQKADSNKAAARSEKEVEEAIDKRIAKEKQAAEDAARSRGRELERQSKAETDTFEKQSRDEKRNFERLLNAEQKAFADAQKADKETFEKGLLAEQKAFNDSEKAKDSQFQKQKQDAERAFNAQQQAQKAAFDKAQQQAARDFDTKQNADKLAAEGQFAKRRVEIERQLQLEAAVTPEDKAKLEAEFKAADEKAAKEKAAFAQLKAEEEAFALKQQQAKIAFDEQQRAAAAALDAQQQAAKIAFDDAQKAKDVAFEAQKQAAKLAFEDQLKAKRDALEATQNAEKLAFEDQLNLKKQEFEDAERAKKAAFDDAQNEKKIAFEDAERAKKQAFEDNLKTLEKQFKKEERDKDIAAAKQVAAIKSGSGTPVIAAKPLATGGSFRAGEQLLVGERGAELVKFGTSGTVTNAATTRQIMQSSNSSPNGANMARVEALLGQLVGKMDRPNIAVQTSENPSDVVVKVQREIARAAAMGAGI